MIEKLKAWFQQLVTEPDGVTHCPVRWLALVGSVQGLGMQAWAFFYQHAAFSLQEFGVGLGAVIVTVGAALGLKKDTPPHE